ncbi:MULTISPECIES: hypothetical protein [Aeromonas]|uniref:hypothetical protein n=1 Tax=Aeromonas TaxID=642 RepID=UPI002B0620FD|nr:hypothetical protein [Aeromonas jandaei]
MFIYAPNSIIRDDGKPSDNASYMLEIRRASSMFLYENRDVKPTSLQFKEAAEYLTSNTGICIHHKQAEAILSLYPIARIKLAKHGVTDTDVCDELAFASAHFFLGCSWPTFGDKINMDEFIALMRKQAGLMGFACIEKK